MELKKLSLFDNTLTIVTDHGSYVADDVDNIEWTGPADANILNAPENTADTVVDPEVVKQQQFENALNRI